MTPVIQFHNEGPMPREVYLDANATHPILRSVRESMAQLLLSDGGELANPSSPHAKGREARKLLNTLKKEFLTFLKRPADENVVLTSGATESINMVIRGLVDSEKTHQRKLVFWTTSVEHAAVLSTLASVDATIEILKVDSMGQIPALEWQRFFSWIEKSSDDLCLSLQVANNETGIVFDLLPILHQLQKITLDSNRKRWIHLDMAQSLGKLSEDYLSQLMDLAQFASFSAHKMGAPSGIGALWCKQLGCFKPMITGGGQEEGLRSGTWNALGAFGFLKALEDWKIHGEKYRLHLSQLRLLALDRLQKLPGFKLHGPLEAAANLCLPNTLNFSFQNTDTDTLIPSLDMAGFQVSGTSACSSGASKSSHVILALGFSDREAKNSIRMSLGVESQLQDVEAFCDFLASKVR